MADEFDLPAWLALFIGLYALAAAVGELRRPGEWLAIARALEREAGARFLAGLICLPLGAAIYLVNPWRPGDWLALAVSVIGGIAVAKGLVLLAAGDRLPGAAGGLAGRMGKAGAGLAALIGFALVLAALARL